MDHLPTPENSYNPIVLPYREAEKFDGGDLITYPGRCGRSIGEFIASKRQYLDRRSVKDAIAFLTMTIASLSEEQISKFGNILYRLKYVLNAILLAFINGSGLQSLSSIIPAPTTPILHY
jgi:hypothetical protein